MFSAILLLALALPSQEKPPNPGEPIFQFQFRKPTDTIAVRKDKGRTLLTVTSKSGIGNAAVTLKAGQWPSQVVVYLQYAEGQGFSNLEGFVLRTDRLHVKGNLKSSRKMEFCFL